MSYWKNKVVPKFKKIFDKSKKKSASETCKSFDSSKESFDKQVEEQRSDLHPKVVEIYKSTTVISKKLLKEPSEPAVKENSEETQEILGELAKAGFPQAQFLCDAGAKCGPGLLPGPIVYLFQKTSTFLVDEPMPEMPQETREIAIEGEPSKEEAATAAIAESSDGTAEKAESIEEKKEVVPEGGKEKVAAEAEVSPVEAKKEVVAQVEAEVETIKPAIVTTGDGPDPTKEETKEVAAVKEEGKEEVAKAAPSETKKEDAPKSEEKKEKSAGISFFGGKK